MYGFFTPLTAKVSKRTRPVELEDGTIVFYDIDGNIVDQTDMEKKFDNAFLFVSLFGSTAIAGIIGGLLAKPISKQITNKTLSKVALIAVPSLFMAVATRRYMSAYPLVYTVRTGENIQGKKLSEGYLKSEAQEQVETTIFPIVGSTLGYLVSQKTKSKSMIPIVIGGFIGAFTGGLTQLQDREYRL